MAQCAVKTKRNQKNHWVKLLNELTDQAAGWALAQNWSIYRDSKPIRDDSFGLYRAPVLRIRLPEGEVWLDPVGHDILGGGEGRVDLEAWPSLHRIMLIRVGDSWKIVADAGRKLRKRWSEPTFVQLVRELATAV